MILDSAKSTRTAATRSTGQWPKWLRPASWRYDSFGCYVPRARIRRLSHREKPDWYRGRPSQTVPLNRHSRTRHRLGVRSEESWPKEMAESMVGGRSSTKMIQRCPASSFGFQALGSAELLKATPPGSVPLTSPSSLSTVPKVPVRSVAHLFSFKWVCGPQLSQVVLEQSTVVNKPQ